MPLPLIPIIVVGAVVAAGGGGVAAPKVLRRLGGQKTLIVGPAGSGKTTLTRMLNTVSHEKGQTVLPWLKVTDPTNELEVKDLIRDRARKSNTIMLVVSLAQLEDPHAMKTAMRHAKQVSLQASETSERVLVLSHLDAMAADDARDLVLSRTVTDLRVALGARRAVAVNLHEPRSAYAILGIDDPDSTAREEA